MTYQAGPALLLCLLLWMAGAGQARADESAPLRLGVYHQRPRLCRGDEPAQRDLRILRLAFGVGRSPAQWRDWPWFYRPVAHPPGDAQALWIALDTATLWGHPPYWYISGHPDYSFAAYADRLARWRNEVLQKIGGLQPAPFIGLAAFRIPAGDRDPFLTVRLTGQAVLPFTALPDNPATAPCRNWPAAISISQPFAGRPYRINSTGTPGSPPFVLDAYARRSAMWADLARGRLDAVLAEGADLDSVPDWANRRTRVRWAARLGGQQIVLRLGRRGRSRLPLVARRALSLALPRDELAHLTPGGGGFVGARHFLSPLLGPSSIPPASDLMRDTLQARRLWVGLQAAPQEVLLRVPAHPLLERMAFQIKAQWKRTLNVAVTVEPLPFDTYAAAVEQPDTDLALAVADFDDGSLETLWQNNLETAAELRDDALPISAETMRAWEQALRSRMPYLPLLQNVHYTAVRADASTSMLPLLCPECRPYDPVRETVRPEALPGPQG